MKKYLSGAVAAAALVFAAPAFATVEVVVTDIANVDADVGNGPATSTVHLTAEFPNNDNFVYGTVAGPDSDVVVVIEGLENIKPSNDGNGQPWVQSTDVNTDTQEGLNYLDFSLEGGFTFSSIEFNLNVFPNTGPPTPWSVQIWGYTPTNGTESSIFNGVTSDSFFNVFTTNGERLTHVRFSTPTDLFGVGQIRISGVAAVVPEPATWAMLLLGFGGMGAVLRRNRRLARMAFA